MNTMLMSIFNTTPQALKGVIALKDLQRTGDIKLYTTAVIAKDASGTISIKQASETGLNRTPLGLLGGILLGMLGGPVGLVMGSFIGGLVGLIFDLAKAGISTDFLAHASQALPSGQAALLAEIGEVSVTPVNTKLMHLSAHVYRQPRSEFVEEQLEDELDAINMELS